MEIDSNKFMNLVMEKTNTKLNSLQAQVIVLESQLQLAAEQHDHLVAEMGRLQSQIAKKEKKSETL